MKWYYSSVFANACHYASLATESKREAHSVAIIFIESLREAIMNRSYNILPSEVKKSQFSAIRPDELVRY